MISMIVATSTNGVIGIGESIPWMGKYSEDMKRFRRLTLNSSIIMGSNTWRSIGSKPLPKRDNFIISSQLETSNAVVCRNISHAINLCDPTKDIWIIGGASIYSQSMSMIDAIDLTIIPEEVDERSNKDVVKFPWINPAMFRVENMETGPQGLLHVKYLKYT